MTGSYIKIKNGRRVTVGSNGLRQRRVLVFGGSTVFCAEVPDLLTSSSQLQQLILKNNFDFDVLNYGIPGLRIENQFNILKNVPDLGPDDIVVFYDGVNDLIRVFEEGLNGHKNQAPWRQLNNFSFAVEKRSSLFRHLSISGYVDNIGVANDYLDSGAKQYISDNWLKYEKLARELVQKTGADFVHILQPNWLTYKKLSEGKSEDKRFSDMRIIQEIFKDNATQNSGILDFTDILNSLTDTPFLDWVHLDDVGDKKIAEEMFTVLKPLLEAQKK
ncbi:MAG: SGNH/GDSL hydrolase family protein [Actinobacteria bacterium]|nr:MAG: SGNH/GDSL hydrolase family protein [Actinomycetota bacterium]